MTQFLITSLSAALLVLVLVVRIIPKKGSNKVGEEVRVHISEPEQRLLKGVAPVGEEKLGDVGGSGEVESVVVGLEVLMQDFNVGGEGGGGRARNGATEEREEVVFEVVEPFGMVVLERPRILVAVEKGDCERNTKKIESLD